MDPNYFLNQLGNEYWDPSYLLAQQSLMFQMNNPGIQITAPVFAQSSNVATCCEPSTPQPVSEIVPKCAIKEPPKPRTPIVEPSIPFEMGSLPNSDYYPTHFMRGTMLQTPKGNVKKVEDVCSDDFIRCAAESKEVTVNVSVVKKINASVGSVSVIFHVGHEKVQVPLIVQHEHPFYVMGKGWTSYDPKKTADTYGLECAELKCGDVCVVLTKPDDGNNIATDIINAEKDLEMANEKLFWRDKLIDTFDKYLSGRRSAPPERLVSNPAPRKMRKMSDSFI